MYLGDTVASDIKTVGCPKPVDNFGWLDADKVDADLATSLIPPR
jgi:hypothetical protein